jgi:hypothetical protein
MWHCGNIIWTVQRTPFWPIQWPGYGTDNRQVAVQFPAEERFFHFSKVSRAALGLTQPAIQWIQGAISLWTKRPRRETDHLPPSSVVVTNAWSYTVTPTHTSSWRAQRWLYPYYWISTTVDSVSTLTVLNFFAVCIRPYYRNEGAPRDIYEMYNTHTHAEPQWSSWTETKDLVDTKLRQKAWNFGVVKRTGRNACIREQAYMKLSCFANTNFSLAIKPYRNKKWTVKKFSQHPASSCDFFVGFVRSHIKQTFTPDDSWKSCAIKAPSVRAIPSQLSVCVLLIPKDLYEVPA